MVVIYFFLFTMIKCIGACSCPVDIDTGVAVDDKTRLGFCAPGYPLITGYEFVDNNKKHKTTPTCSVLGNFSQTEM